MAGLPDYGFTGSQILMLPVAASGLKLPLWRSKFATSARLA